jgi:hypothetical protein
MPLELHHFAIVHFVKSRQLFFVPRLGNLLKKSVQRSHVTLLQLVLDAEVLAAQRYHIVVVLLQ